MINDTKPKIVKISRRIYYVPSLKRIYIGHYNLNFHCLGPTMLVQIIEFYFLIYIIFPYIPRSEKSKNSYMYFIMFYSFLTFTFIINIIVGPGYLPFNYFKNEETRRNRKEKRNFDNVSNREIKDSENPEKFIDNEIYGNEIGIAISDDDIKSVNSTLMIDLNSNSTYFLSYLSFFKLPPIISFHQPPLAEYLASENRYVIMPLIFDNFCGTWVGKKNAKLFLIYRIFSSISSMLIFFLFLDILVYFVEDYCFGTYFFGCLCLSLVFLIKSFFQIVLCLRIINRIAFTKFYRFGKISYDGNDEDSEELTFTLSEVFRNLKNFLGDNILLWILPIPPFRGFSDEELYSLEKKKFILS